MVSTFLVKTAANISSQLQSTVHMNSRLTQHKNHQTVYPQRLIIHVTLQR